MNCVHRALVLQLLPTPVLMLTVSNMESEAETALSKVASQNIPSLHRI